MRYAWLAAAAVACGNSSAKQDAASNPNVCPDPQPLPSPICDNNPHATVPNRCGDGVWRNCWTRLASDSPCPMFFKFDEQCDGSDVPTCASLGLGAGTVTCTGTCTVNTNACGACGSDARVTTCMIAPETGGELLVASDPAAAGGPYLALMASNHGVNDGFVVLRREAVGFSQHGGVSAALDVRAIAAVPDGWFLAGMMSTSQVFVSRIDLLDTTDSNQMFATSNPVGAVSIAYGPGQHALVAWVEYVTDGSNVMHPQTRFAVLDSTGAIVATPATLFPSTDDAAGTSVTTDGTSFFVAASGRLARITSTGSVAAVLTGFPTIADPLSRVAPVVHWGASTGWFATKMTSATPWLAQPFDATGAASGSDVITPTLASAPAVLGDDLVLAAAGSATGATVALSAMKLPLAGTAPTTIPMGNTAVAAGFGTDTVVAPFAGGLAVLFHSAAGPVLALVAF